MAKVDMETLQRENEALRQKLAEQEASRVESTSKYSYSLQKEIAKIRQTQSAKQGAAGIVVRERHDHKNITLWTRDGESIGPMHPDNAIQLMNQRAAVGVILSVTRPTQEQIDVYKETQEYKDKILAERKRRALKSKSRKSDNMERLVEAMEKQFGVPSNQINAVLSQDEVRSKK